MFLLFIQDAIAQTLDPVILEAGNQGYNHVKDSIHIDSILPIVEESLELIRTIAENTHPAPYTIENLNIGRIGLYVGLISAVLAGLGAGFSYLTARNVKRVNKKTQENLLVDLIRHLYRNEICTLAFIAKWKNNPGQYPADEHLLKLQTLPDDIHLEKYNSKPQHYEKMHELSLLLRNYNTEIEVTHKHISDPKIQTKVIERDLDTLIFKPIYLINRICEAMDLILNRKSTKERAGMLIMSEHYKKLKDNYNGNVWTYKGDVELMLDAKTEGWIKKLMVNKSAEKSNRKDKDEMCQRYTACMDIAKCSDKFTDEDLERLNELSEKEDSEKKRRKELGENEKEELDKLQIKNLHAVLFDETECCKSDDLQWNDLKTILEVIATDVTIEYSKIGMIEYPGKMETLAVPKETLEDEYTKAWTIIKSILTEKISADRISFNKTREYLAVKVDQKNICQLYLKGKKKYFEIKDVKNKWWTRIDIQTVNDIKKHAQLFRGLEI